MSSKKKRNIIIWSIVAVVIVVAAWFGFSNHQTAAPKTVTVGIVGGSKPQDKVWAHVSKTAKKKYGIIVKTKNFTDYNQPNKALKDGDIDLNAFQHQSFLNSWNKANHGNIVAIGKTYISPIRLYSKKYKKLSQLPKGATLVVPNDPTNESRALYVLKNAGLIQLRHGAKLVTVADITINPNNYKIKEVSGEQCGRVINSVDAAVVNNDFSGPAGLGKKETIYVEPVNKDSEQWINVICARKSQANKKEFKEVVKAFQTAETKRIYKKYYGDEQIAAWDITLK